MKNSGGKGTRGNNGKSEARKDRKSGTGLSGSPKKGGHGGKFTWAGDGYSQAEMGRPHREAALDAKDPLFEDPEDAVAASSTV